ncbi:hypothetical protein C453_00545 [Haloferax elongans ATCC BAA-1513]|uniref:Uncharacterized protein n=1 Tax=Haloferax elongans ATCC BAA-1513 TaxID=1230453 RepID=M0I2B8_HALEO|nr:hypothetical protein C453_00545 [Haloferax elongans ATCC BAA-1513]
MLESQTKPSLVYRQDSRSATDDNVASGMQHASQAGASMGGHTQFAQHQSGSANPPAHRDGFDTGSVSSHGRRGTGSNQSPRQQQHSASRVGDSTGGSPFETRRLQNPDTGSTLSPTGDHRQPSEDNHSQRAQGRIDDLDVQLGEQSMQLNADVDRLVDVLYRKLERKHRMERQRRGF